MATVVKLGQHQATAMTDTAQWRRLKALAAMNGRPLQDELQAAIDAHLTASNGNGGDQGA